jgi:chitinase
VIEIELTKEDSFPKIRETLTRIGIANNKTKTIYQSCHILNKRGKVYIVHFKELLALDGRVAVMTDEDIERRNDITKLLAEWGLCQIVDPASAPSTRRNLFRIISYTEANEGGWNKVYKYNIGQK